MQTWGDRKRGLPWQLGCVYIECKSACFAMWAWPTYTLVSVNAHAYIETHARAIDRAHLQHSDISVELRLEGGKNDWLSCMFSSMVKMLLPDLQLLLLLYSVRYFYTHIRSSSLSFILLFTLRFSVSFHFPELIYLLSPQTAWHHHSRGEWKNWIILLWWSVCVNAFHLHISLLQSIPWLILNGLITITCQTFVLLKKIHLLNKMQCNHISQPSLCIWRSGIGEIWQVSYCVTAQMTHGSTTNTETSSVGTVI